MLKQKIQEDLKQAMRDKAEQKLSVLRMLMSAISNEEIAKGVRDSGLSDDQTIVMVKREAKKRSDAADAYRKGGDETRASQEETELSMLKAYLPPEVSEEQIGAVVAEILAAHPGATQKEFGLLMKEAVAKLGAGADGKKVSETIKQRLASSV